MYAFRCISRSSVFCISIWMDVPVLEGLLLKIRSQQLQHTWNIKLVSRTLIWHNDNYLTLSSKSPALVTINGLPRYTVHFNTASNVIMCSQSKPQSDLVDIVLIHIYIYISTHFAHFERTALILCVRVSTRCWQHSSEVLVYMHMIASQSCSVFVGYTFSESTKKNPARSTFSEILWPACLAPTTIPHLKLLKSFWCSVFQQFILTTSTFLNAVTCCDGIGYYIFVLTLY